MLLATALLLLHPQLASNVSLTAKNGSTNPPAATVSVTATSLDLDTELPFSNATASPESAPQPEAESSAELPDAPLPLAPVTAPEPIAFIKPAGKPYTVSVQQLRAENRRKELMWRGLIIASSGAATFDAWSTRYTITHDGAQEMNPLLKPFAGNASLYAVIQVAPVALDYAGRKMMYSRHPWVRRMWWAPQSASFATSLFCGSHNLAFH
jgi:hypothetical protein